MTELIAILIIIFRIAYWLITILCKAIFFVLLGLIILLTTVFSKNKKEEVGHSKASSSSRFPTRRPKKKHTPKRRQGHQRKYRINEYGEVFEQNKSNHSFG